jgi:hypothetical protein
MAVKISMRPNGPYLVEGEVELVDVDDNKIDTSALGPRFGGLGLRVTGARQCPSPAYRRARPDGSGVEGA